MTVTSNHMKGYTSSNTWNRRSFTRSATPAPATSIPAGGASPDRLISTGMATHDQNTALFGDNRSHFQQDSPETPTTSMQTNSSGLLMDFSSINRVRGGLSTAPHVDPLSAAVSHFSTPVNEYTSPWTVESFFNNNIHGDRKSAIMKTSSPTNNSVSNVTRNSDTVMTGYQTSPPSPSSLANDTCNCHSGVTELLVSLHGGGHEDRRLSIDVQLAKLKRCISSAESSMACCHSHGNGEPIHIMTVAMLIGFVIDEFEMLACDLLSPAPQSHLSPADTSTGTGVTGSSVANIAAALGVITGAERASGSSLFSGSNPHISVGGPGASMSPSSLMEPWLSWGMLELEDDDEVGLRKRLYSLSFRKLERLLSQMTMYLGNLQDSQAYLTEPSRHMAFVMACNYTLLWLEKKAGDVKRLLWASVGDGIMDGLLV
ncbi:hypothetical protein KVR01_010254 [Diaporthe batatas]|uniref:uncharacterized protein n=1 Tax=Diaporthe batatas TaxID=748121 RepID=UPI001D037181|nr:uncharacterized protein KVR01_010254 [Diaporthe batatas]KAG8159617.1 hypothetical protein KVR01_010254 [Diaporthe batatas]